MKMKKAAGKIEKAANRTLLGALRMKKYWLSR